MKSASDTPGNYVKILHTFSNGDRYISVYYHLRDVYVEVGDQILTNQVIGTVGNTGYVRDNPEAPLEDQGCHLHFEILRVPSNGDITDSYSVDSELLVQYGDISSPTVLGISDSLDFGFGQSEVVLECKESPYKLPWPGDISHEVSQDFLNDGGSHVTGEYYNQYALDFGMGFGEEIATVADGTIYIATDKYEDGIYKQFVNQGGCSSSYASTVNMVTIKYDDQTSSICLHLMKNSIPDRLQVPGTKIKRGEIIGKVGYTGWTCGYHLHFTFLDTATLDSAGYGKSIDPSEKFSDDSICNEVYKGTPVSVDLGGIAFKSDNFPNMIQPISPIGNATPEPDGNSIRFEWEEFLADSNSSGNDTRYYELWIYDASGDRPTSVSGAYYYQGKISGTSVSVPYSTLASIEGKNLTWDITAYYKDIADSNNNGNTNEYIWTDPAKTSFKITPELILKSPVDNSVVNIDTVKKFLNFSWDFEGFTNSEVKKAVIKYGDKEFNANSALEVQFLEIDQFPVNKEIEWTVEYQYTNSSGVTLTAKAEPFKLKFYLPYTTVFKKDIDGNGYEDLCKFNEEEVNYYCDTDPGKIGFESQNKIGDPKDLPVVGDINGDGISERCVYREGELICPGVIRIKFGEVGSIPAIGDLNGDGYDELCVYSTSGVECAMNRNGVIDTSRTVSSPMTNIPFGYLALGDINSDGLDDICSYSVDTLRCVSTRSSTSSISGIALTDTAVSIKAKDGSTSELIQFGSPGDQPLLMNTIYFDDRDTFCVYRDTVGIICNGGYKTGGKEVAEVVNSPLKVYTLYKPQGDVIEITADYERAGSLVGTGEYFDKSNICFAYKTNPDNLYKPVYLFTQNSSPFRNFYTTEKNFSPDSYDDDPTISWSLGNGGQPIFYIDDAVTCRAHTNTGIAEVDPATGLSPVYRFYKPIEGQTAHLYVIGNDAKDKIQVKYSISIWRFDMTAFYAFKNRATGTVPVYQYWSDVYQSLLYVATENSITIPDYLNPALAFYAYPPITTKDETLKDDYNGSSPVQRYINTENSRQTHFYNLGKSVDLSSINYRHERVAYYAFGNPSEFKGSVVVPPVEPPTNSSSVDLRVYLTPSKTTVSKGEQFTMSMNTHNMSSTITATGVVSKLTLPSGYSLVSKPSSCSLSGSIVICNYSSIMPGIKPRADIVLKLNNTGYNTFKAETSGSQNDPVTSNNTVTERVNVIVIKEESVYRFGNNHYPGTHFYLLGDTERDNLKSKIAPGGDWAGAYTFEGEAWKSYRYSNGCVNGTEAVYRFRNKKLGGTVHFYVMGTANKDSVINKSKPGGTWAGVFSYEGTSWYTW
ncbi:MAG: peptidoglycan DD-metalloendopeptidase family protein [Candidatus Dojkabacteria bacterium]|nr:peptidoglycan DD-metalloendopeptidase family protein [Candidatus Dojkabacteria bacterium]